MSSKTHLSTDRPGQARAYVTFTTTTKPAHHANIHWASPPRGFCCSYSTSPRCSCPSSSDEQPQAPHPGGVSSSKSEIFASYLYVSWNILVFISPAITQKGKNHFGSHAARNQAVGWIWPGGRGLPSPALGHGAGRAQQQVRIKVRSSQLGSVDRQTQTLSCGCTRPEGLLAKGRNTDQFIQTFATTIARRRKYPHFRDRETKAQGQALQEELRTLSPWK